MEALFQREDLSQLISSFMFLGLVFTGGVAFFVYMMTDLLLHNWPQGVEKASLRLITAIGIAVVSGLIGLGLGVWLF